MRPLRRRTDRNHAMPTETLRQPDQRPHAIRDLCPRVACLAGVGRSARPVAGVPRGRAADPIRPRSLAGEDGVAGIVHPARETADVTIPSSDAFNIASRSVAAETTTARCSPVSRSTPVTCHWMNARSDAGLGADAGRVLGPVLSFGLMCTQIMAAIHRGKNTIENTVSRLITSRCGCWIRYAWRIGNTHNQPRKITATQRMNRNTSVCGSNVQASLGLGWRRVAAVPG